MARTYKVWIEVEVLKDGEPLEDASREANLGLEGAAVREFKTMRKAQDFADALFRLGEVLKV